LIKVPYTVIEVIPLAKKYFFDFYSGKDWTKSFGSSDSVTKTLWELVTCFLASTNSERNILQSCCSDRS